MAADTKEEICVRKWRFPTVWEVGGNYLDFVVMWLVAVEAFGAFWGRSGGKAFC
jgi:hypothetical protein